MFRARLSVLSLSAAMLGSLSPATAQEADVGQIEFMASCAQCHGTDGRGDGVISGYLTVPAADLTELAAANGGSFPFEEVYASIASGRRSEAHGTREMPAWGDRYAVEAMQYFGLPYSPEERDAFIHGQILALIGYLETIQN